MDAWSPLHVLIFLVGVLTGTLIAWSPRLVLLRLRRRINLIEEFLVSDRNKKASKIRWEKPDESSLLMAEIERKKNQPVLDNEFGSGWNP